MSEEQDFPLLLELVDWNNNDNARSNMSWQDWLYKGLAIFLRGFGESSESKERWTRLVRDNLAGRYYDLVLADAAILLFTVTGQGKPTFREVLEKVNNAIELANRNHKTSDKQQVTLSSLADAKDWTPLGQSRLPQCTACAIRSQACQATSLNATTKFDICRGCILRGTICDAPVLHFSSALKSTKRKRVISAPSQPSSSKISTPSSMVQPLPVANNVGVLHSLQPLLSSGYESPTSHSSLVTSSFVIPPITLPLLSFYQQWIPPRIKIQSWATTYQIDKATLAKLLAGGIRSPRDIHPVNGVGESYMTTVLGLNELELVSCRDGLWRWLTDTQAQWTLFDVAFKDDYHF